MKYSSENFEGGKRWNPWDVVVLSVAVSDKARIGKWIGDMWKFMDIAIPLLFHPRCAIAIPPQMRTMVLIYLPTWMGDVWGFYVGKYSSTMDHLGLVFHRSQRFPPQRSTSWCLLRGEKTPLGMREIQQERPSLSSLWCPRPFMPLVCWCMKHQSLATHKNEK